MSKEGIMWGIHKSLWERLEKSELADEMYNVRYTVAYVSVLPMFQRWAMLILLSLILWRVW